MSFQEWVNNLWQQLVQFGYLGIFLLSFIGASSILIPIPYTIIIFLLAANPANTWNPILLALAGGAGAALGEFTGYLLGFYGRKIVSKERQRKMEFLVKLFGRYGPIAIFVFALTPLPDDLLFIPLGILRYKFINAFVPALLGKILMIYLLAYFGRIGGNIILLIFGAEGSAIGMAIATIFLVIILVVLLRVDWEKVFEKYVVKRGESKK